MRYLQFFYMAGLLLLCSCGTGKFFPKETGSGTTTSGNNLYVANSSTAVSSVAGFTIANSALSNLANSPYAIGLPPTALAITPKNTFLYIGSSTGGGIYVYTINSDGTLTIGNGGSPAVTGIYPVTMRVDPTGQWLLAADATPQAYVFGINASTGALTTQGNPLGLDVGSTSHLFITPNGQYVFVSLGTGGVDMLNFNTSTGVISTNQILHPKSSNNGDFGLATDPNSTYLFVTETGINSLRVLTINSNGTLTELSTSPVKTGLGPSQVLVTTSGSYVYVTNQTDGTISGFALTANGALTALPNSPYATGTAPVDLVEDNTHAYIAVACSGGNPDMQVFSIDTASPGQLDAFASKTTGTDPTLASAIVATN